MDESELSDKFYSYAFYALAATMAMLAVVSASYPIIIISALLLALAALYFKSGHIINNLLIKRSKVIEKANGFRLSSSLSALTRKQGRGYRAVSIALLRFNGTVDSSTDSMRLLLESIREQFEFSLSMVQVDKARLLDSLDGKRRMKEIQLSRLDKDKYDRSNQLRREMRLIESEMQGIRQAGSAFETMARIKAVADADSEAEAARQAQRSLERIGDAFLATTKLDYEMVKGEALLSLAGDFP